MGLLKEEEFRAVWGFYPLCLSCIIDIQSIRSDEPNINYSCNQYESLKHAIYLMGELRTYASENTFLLPDWYLDSITPKQYVFPTYAGGNVENSAFTVTYLIGSMFEFVCHHAWIGLKKGVCDYGDEVLERNLELERLFFTLNTNELEEDCWDELIPCLSRLSKDVDKWKKTIDNGPFPLNQLSADLKYEFSILCREHPSLFRKLEGEANQLDQLKQDEYLKKWNLSLDRYKRTVSRKGYDIPATLPPALLNLLLEIINSAVDKRKPSYLEFEQFEDLGGSEEDVVKKKPIPGKIRTQASTLRTYLEVIDMTISSDGNYSLEDLSASQV